jgi:hypothetical protein
MIDPLTGSVDFNTGQPMPSSFASVNSSFVPMILKVLFSGTILPYNGNSAEYRFLSDVRRSSSTLVGDVNLIVEVSLSIFLR